MLAGAIEKENVKLKKNQSIDRGWYKNSSFDDNIIFEDFARLRLNESE